MSFKKTVASNKIDLFLPILNFRTGLTFGELLPEDRTQYDKMRPPKKDGAPTIVYFHVTVMGLDSIDETSMASFIRFILF